MRAASYAKAKTGRHFFYRISVLHKHLQSSTAHGIGSSREHPSDSLLSCILKYCVLRWNGIPSCCVPFLQRTAVSVTLSQALAH